MTTSSAKVREGKRLCQITGCEQEIDYNDDGIPISYLLWTQVPSGVDICRDCARVIKMLENPEQFREILELFTLEELDEAAIKRKLATKEATRELIKVLQKKIEQP